jgi:cysteine-rich repeat protein
MRSFVFGLALGGILLTSSLAYEVKAATVATTTTILSVSICGNAIVDDGEQCDVPGEIGTYSTTIAGRQCNAQCNFGPYCGDGILQTLFTEECDDGNNDNGDFCSAICKIEPAGSGGGGSAGGGSGGRGGSTRELGQTQVSITGRAYPGRPVNILLDATTVGSVQADNQGRFEFTTNADPGTATLGIWSTDSAGTRSITLNSTFDVTQGAITNVNGLVLPPTLRLSNANPNPGDTITLSGQAIPGARIEVQVGTTGGRTLTATSSPNGQWQATLATAGLNRAEYAIRARSQLGTSPLVTQSNWSSTVQMFLGVEGRATTPSDLSRDGRINLTDFSILIFWWNSNGGNSNPSADINSNGRVGIEDFSILLFNWTG